MIFKTKEEKEILKKAKEKAHQEYLHFVAREKAKKEFLESNDDFDFYKELLRGLDVNPALKIIIEKRNGTRVILKLNEDAENQSTMNDWIDFSSITNLQNEARVR